jgi:hypothetical protein
LMELRVQTHNLTLLPSIFQFVKHH